MEGKILIFGATGRVGKELTRQASLVGENVIAAVRDPNKAKEMELGNVEIKKFEFGDNKKLDYIFEGADRVYLVTPPTSERALENAKAIVDKAAEKGIRKIVALSAMSVESGSNNILGQRDKYVEESGINYTILRPNWFMQNFVTTFKPMIVEKGAIDLPAEDSEISFIDTRDIASTAIACFQNSGHKNKIHTLTGPETLGHYEVADIISEVSGKTITYNPISDEEYRNNLKEMGYPDNVINQFSKLFKNIRDGNTCHVTMTIKEVTGNPPIMFSQFAEDYAHYWK